MLKSQLGCAAGLGSGLGSGAGKDAAKAPADAVKSLGGLFKKKPPQ
jgi:hypothetical protein